MGGEEGEWGCRRDAQRRAESEEGATVAQMIESDRGATLPAAAETLPAAALVLCCRCISLGC